MVVSDQELEALQGLPLGAQVLYLRELRPRMDYATGTVGRTHRVSWHGMRQALEVESRPGIAREMPSREQVRRLAQHLVRQGLLELISDMAGKQLIMRLPMAIADFCVQKKADRNPTVTRPIEPDCNSTKQDPNNDACFSDVGIEQPDRNPTEQITEIADTHPLSVDRDEMIAREVSAAGEGGSPDEVGGLVGDGSAMGSVADFRRLLGVDGAPSANVQRACVQLAAVLQRRVVMCSELAAAIAESRLRGVGNVAGYAVRIVESGSMLVAPVAKVVPFGRGVSRPAAGGIDALLDGALEEMGYGS